MNTTTYLTFFRFSFQLIFAEAMFLIGRKKKPRFPLRAALFAAYLMAGSTWYFLLSNVPGDWAITDICFYFGLWIFTMLGMRLSFEMSFVEILFAGTGGYAVEHITFALVKLFQYSTGLTAEDVGPVIDNICFRILPYMAVPFLFYGAVIRRHQINGAFKRTDIRMIYTASFAVIFAIVLSVFYSSAPIAGAPDLINSVICPVYSALSCAMVLVMEYYLLHENNLNQEKETMERMLQAAAAQQKSSKDAIDIINMKCHDLKHQMRALETMNSTDERTEYLEELQSVLSIYDASYRTGCEALDYVLREKALIAEKYGVQFSCMADGKAISFLRSTDVYALMGNALDNALESVMREEPGQRLISLNISVHGQMVVLHLENRCSRDLEFLDGLPLTDKEDKNHHGFGVQSIRYIVQKYHGEWFMRTQNGMFILEILFQANTDCIL